ncbi:hypothetical protein WJX72_010393 [[Myrmecia] bisecta]|uniref:RING-CH-type domain-containing protein n=1 Tax=[Myrmecia] bisecta TaxID=41462 RepID=A0AAW1Q1N6_9CHLO
MALVAHSYSSGCGQSSQDVCWVCLDDGTASDPLVQQWHCPRPVHAQCLARWQLHAAGSREETHCRFCDAQLPDWRKVLSPSCMLAGTRCLPTMSVTFNGQLHHIAVRSGPGGYQAFVNDIRNIFGITDECEMNLTFDCADPATGQLLKLNGAGAYNAAVHCAAVAASKRMPGFLPPAGPAALQPYPADAAATNGSSLQEQQALLQLVDRLRCIMDRSGLRPHVPEEDVEQLCCMQLRLRSMLDQAAPQC